MPQSIQSRLLFRNRIWAFLAYLAVPYLCGLVFTPLYPWLRTLHGSGRARFNELFYFSYSAVSLLWAISILKAGIQKELAANVQSGEDAPIPVQEAPIQLLRRRLMLGSSRPLEDIGIGICVCFILLPIVFIALAISSIIFARFPMPHHPVNEQIKALTSIFDRAIILFQAAVFAPALEEIIFRGVLFTALRDRFNLPVGIALSGFIFAAVHPTMPHALLSLWIFGSTMAYIANKRNSLLPNMVAHGMYNATLMLSGLLNGGL